MFLLEYPFSPDLDIMIAIIINAEEPAKDDEYTFIYAAHFTKNV